MRDEIAHSWDRSRAAGLRPDHFELPYTGEVDREGALLRAARDVLDGLAAHLSGEMLSIILTDAQGRVLDRRADDRSLRVALDRISLAPGFSYAEPLAGTNAIGMALADEAPAVVLGGEHFVEVLQPMACYATPVRNPLTQEIEGVLDITCTRSQANGLAMALVTQAGREIERNLYAGVSMSQRVLLQRFLATVRERPSRAVVAVGPDVMIANHTAAAILDSSQRELGWQSVVAAVAPGGAPSLMPGVAEISTAARSIPVIDVGEVVGAILDIDVPDRPVHATAAGRDRDRHPVGMVEELTARERDVLELIVAGRANKQIARQLHITEKTVKTHVSHVFGKLGVQSRTQAAMHAVTTGVVRADLS